MKPSDDANASLVLYIPYNPPFRALSLTCYSKASTETGESQPRFQNVHTSVMQNVKDISEPMFIIIVHGNVNGE